MERDRHYLGRVQIIKRSFPSELGIARSLLSLGQPYLTRHRQNGFHEFGATDAQNNDKHDYRSDDQLVEISAQLDSNHSPSVNQEDHPDSQTDQSNLANNSSLIAPDEQDLDLSSLGIYFRDIARIPLLTAVQEVELAQKMERGTQAKALLEDELQEFSSAELEQLERDIESGTEARTRLIESNLRLVASVARKYLGRGLPLPDLIQEGSLGLNTAVDKFDYRRGFKFSTYAYWWIRQAVTRALANQSRTIRVPVHMIDYIGDVYSEYQKLQQQLGREPDLPELAEAMNTTVEKVREAFRASANPVSLEMPVGSDEEDTLGSFLQDRNAEDPQHKADHALLSEYVNRELHSKLTEREQQVMKLRFGLEDGNPWRLEAIGRLIGVSRERVRQIEAEAIHKLRSTDFRTRVSDYLDD